MDNSYARLIKSMATELWMRSVLKRMGNISCGKAQKKIWPNPTKDGIDISNAIIRHLHRSKNGVPVRDVEFVNAIEKENPGARQILLHPLWDILLHPEASREYIFQCMDRLDFNLKKKLFTSDPITKLLIRKKLNSPQPIYYIAMRNDLDALACLLMLIRESEINGQIGAYLCCKYQTVYLIRRLSLFSPFCMISSILYKIIYTLFIERNNPLPITSLNPFAQSLPTHRLDTPKYISLNTYKNICSGILWNAEMRKVVPPKENEQLAFLFWIDNFIDKIALDETLKNLPKDFDPTHPPDTHPEPLNQLMKKIKGDSRKNLPTTGFLF